jgi:hypothetical protein
MILSGWWRSCVVPCFVAPIIRAMYIASRGFLYFFRIDAKKGLCYKAA